MQKKALILALAVIFTLALSSVAWANDIMPLWDNAKNCTSNLGISGNTAICNLNVDAVRSSDRITTTVTLQKLSSSGTYSYVTSWSSSATGALRFSKTYTVTASGSYRIKCDVNVGGESITVYAYATK